MVRIITVPIMGQDSLWKEYQIINYRLTNVLSTDKETHLDISAGILLCDSCLYQREVWYHLKVSYAKIDVLSINFWERYGIDCNRMKLDIEARGPSKYQLCTWAVLRKTDIAGRDTGLKERECGIHFIRLNPEPYQPSTLAFLCVEQQTGVLQHCLEWFRKLLG